MPIAHFLTLAAPAEGCYVERRSRFLSYAYPVATEEEVKTCVDKLRREYHDARHVCYAYSIGVLPNQRTRTVDDGEPSGTGGRPILAQITSRELTNVLVCVVRYFGGVQLGAANLGRAYGAATAEALNAAALREETLRAEIVATAPYELVDFLKRTAQDCEANILSYDYDAAGMTFRLAPPLDKEEELKGRLTAKYGVNVKQ